MATIKKEYILKIEKIMPIEKMDRGDDLMVRRGLSPSHEFMSPDRYETIFRGSLTSDETISLMRMIIEMRGGER